MKTKENKEAQRQFHELTEHEVVNLIIAWIVNNQASKVSVAIEGMELVKEVKYRILPQEEVKNDDEG